MKFKLGLTGSIGMGKSTTARLFAELGCAVWDADVAVHRLYAKGGAAVEPMRQAFPGAVHDGSVSREILREIIQQDKSALKRIEAIVHPLVKRARARFASSTDAEIVVFDIPLLFETGSEQEFGAVAAVYVAPEIQRRRVLDRGTMSAEQFDHILTQQHPADQKAARADFVIETDTLDHARKQVQSVVSQIKDGWRRA